jgi:mRNA-degrading endonuclease RelE of RelBE toxin-antitoxin system
MLQIVFNDLSAAEMAALPKPLQLEILSEFHVLPEDLANLDPKRFGKVERDSRTLYRYRAGDYRIYFEPHADGLLVRRVLTKNTIRDFLFRTSLPTGEDEQLEENGAFWQLIDESEPRR